MARRVKSADRLGRVFFDSWAGRTSAAVRIVGETATNYRVVLLDKHLGYAAGKVLHPPKGAVQVDGEQAAESPDRRTQ